MTPCAPGTILGVQFIIIYSIFPPFFVFLRLVGPSPGQGEKNGAFARERRNNRGRKEEWLTLSLSLSLGEAGAEASDVSRVTPVWQGFCLPIMAAYVK
jgi:hypothetical protein